MIELAIAFPSENVVLFETTYPFPVNKGQGRRFGAEQKKFEKSGSSNSNKFSPSIKGFANIEVRTKQDAGYGDKDASHFCSLKVAAANMPMRTQGVPVYVPAVSYNNRKSHTQRQSLDNFMDITKHGEFEFSKELRNGVKSFIYQNQMALILYWQYADQDEIVKEWLGKYFANQLRSGSHYKERAESAPTDDELVEQLRWIRRSLQFEYGYEEVTKLKIAGIDELIEETGFAFDEYFKKDE